MEVIKLILVLIVLSMVVKDVKNAFGRGRW